MQKRFKLKMCATAFIKFSLSAQIMAHSITFPKSLHLIKNFSET